MTAKQKKPNVKIDANWREWPMYHPEPQESEQETVRDTYKGKGHSNSNPFWLYVNGSDKD